MSLTPEQVEERFVNDDDLYWGELEYYSRHDKAPEKVVIEGVEYELTVLDTSPRGEWDYDTHIVFQLGDQIFRKTGHFQSHYGNDWDGPLQEVQKVEKTIEVWEPKS